MADSGKPNQQEPSMEEILSSIRRIIADEDAPQDAGGGDLHRDGEEDVLELTDRVEPDAPPEPRPTIAPAPPAAAPSVSAPPAAARRPIPPEPTRVSAMADTGDSLISPSAAQTSTQALSRLTRAAAGEERSAAGLGGLTVEQLLVNLLTPMLKDWLDQNLAPIVERVVEQEVKKLARRAEML